MATRYDILSVREDGNGKAWFTKCGAMFENKAGDGFNITMDVMPAPVDGQFRLLAKIPKPRDGVEQTRKSFPDAQPVDELDDQIPW